MWVNQKELEDTLKNIERLKVGIMKQLNELNANKDSIAPTTVYPMAKVQPMIINEYPVFQFSYEGMLPHYKENDKEYNSMIKDYYFRSTIDAYDFEQITHEFEQSYIIFVQYFENEVVRDLDNRNKKHIQDAIRNTNIIADDNWQNVWTTDLGFKDVDKNHVQVYVVSRDNYIDFISYLLEHHEEMKESKKDAITKEEFFLEYQERKRKEKDARKLNLTDQDRSFYFG